jgi:ribonuclease R
MDTYLIPKYPENLLTKSSYYLEEYRVDLRHLPVYTIDPSGSTDADDAFSVESSGSDLSNWNLYVHIADPTAFFEPHDEQFKCIQYNGVTQYPSLRPPRHMFPSDIVNACTLTEGIKPAITVKHQINNNTIINSECFLSMIQCDLSNRLTYEQAGSAIDDKSNRLHKLLMGLITLTNTLRNKRMIGCSFHSSPCPADLIIDASGKFAYSSHSTGTIEAKRVIEEMAIQTNRAVAEQMCSISGGFLSRECDATSIIDDGTPTKDLILEILTKGYIASYTKTVNQHRILNVKAYSHFTSPLRRFSDCITHFCIKHSLIQKKDSELFTSLQMTQYAMSSNNATKRHRNISFQDANRMFQYIHQELTDGNSDHVPITFIHSGIIGNRYINALIRNIND